LKGTWDVMVGTFSNFIDRLQRCWAHLLREAEWLSEHCSEGKALYLALKRLFVDLTDDLMGDPSLSVRRRLKLKGERRMRYWINKQY
jgi:transposase